MVVRVDNAGYGGSVCRVRVLRRAGPATAMHGGCGAGGHRGGPDGGADKVALLP